MSSLIRDFEDEFATECEGVKRTVQGLRAGFPAAGASPIIALPAGAITKDRVTANHNISTSLRRMRTVLAQLEMELAQSPEDVRRHVVDRLARYKSTLLALEKEAAAVKKLSGDADREELLWNAKSTAERNVLASTSADDETLRMKQQLARTTAIYKASSDKVREMEALTNGMNAQADLTLEELLKQGVTIRNIAEKVVEVDRNLSLAQRTLAKMRRHMLKNKLMLAAIIAVLLIMITGILYYQYGRTMTMGHARGDAVSGISNGGSADHSVPTLPPSSTSDSWMPTLPPPSEDAVTSISTVTPPPPPLHPSGPTAKPNLNR